MDTPGLAALGLVDGQCLYRAVDPSEMARWMYGLGKRIFTEGDTFKDGQAIPGPNVLRDGSVTTSLLSACR